MLLTILLLLQSATSSQISVLVNTIFQIINGIGTLVILYLTYKHNRNIARLTKESDVLMECHRRYDQLLSEARFVEKDREANAFYSRFWHLQQNQYEFWMSNVIPFYVFKEWMNARRDSFKTDAPISKYSTYKYKAGWQENGKLSLNTGFVDLIDEIHNSTKEVVEILEDFQERQKKAAKRKSINRSRESF